MILVVYIFSSFILAQEKEQKTELPQLTLERKVARALLNAVAFTVAGIAYAKSKGETPEDFGKFKVKLWGYTFKKYKDIQSYMQKWHRIIQTDKNLKMEILSKTETSISARMNIYGKEDVDYLSGTGVTVDEYFRFWREHLESLTNYLGWNCESEFDGNWITFAVSEK